MYEVRKTRGAHVAPKEHLFVVPVSRHRTLDAAERSCVAAVGMMRESCGLNAWSENYAVFTTRTVELSRTCRECGAVETRVWEPGKFLPEFDLFNETTRCLTCVAHDDGEDGYPEWDTAWPIRKKPCSREEIDEYARNHNITIRFVGDRCLDSSNNVVARLHAW